MCRFPNDFSAILVLLTVILALSGCEQSMQPVNNADRQGFRTKTVTPNAAKNSGRYDEELISLVKSASEQFLLAALKQKREQTWRRNYTKKYALKPFVLECVARVLSWRGLQRYDYVGTEGRSLGEAVKKVKFSAAEPQRGVLLMRDKKDLKKIGEAFYSDGLGNLFEYGSFVGPQDVTAFYSLGDFVGGHRLLTVDLNNDGVVDMALASTLDETFSKIKFAVMANELAKGFWKCFRQGRLGAGLHTGNTGRASGKTPVGVGSNLKVPGGKKKNPCARYGKQSRFADLATFLDEPQCEYGPDMGRIAQGGYRRPPGRSGMSNKISVIIAGQPGSTAVRHSTGRDGRTRPGMVVTGTGQAGSPSDTGGLRNNPRSWLAKHETSSIAVIGLAT